MFDVNVWRKEFPILSREVHGKPLVYLDNAATSQKPNAVIASERHYYEALNANVHRGVHTLSQEATDAFEGARDTVRRFLNAAQREEIIFTRGATEAVNLVAHSWGRSNLKAGDEILVSEMEHHANIVPWQMLCEVTGAVLKVIPIDDRGALVEGAAQAMMNSKTRLVGITQVSNALGTVNPVADMIRAAHAVGAVVLVDGAQAVPHLAVDVQALDCDFYVFSGHKLYAPTGIGVLYGKRELLEKMPPYQGGMSPLKKPPTTNCPISLRPVHRILPVWWVWVPLLNLLNRLGWITSPPMKTVCWPTPHSKQRLLKDCASLAQHQAKPLFCPSP